MPRTPMEKLTISEREIAETKRLFQNGIREDYKNAGTSKAPRGYVNSRARLIQAWASMMSVK